jgi:crotonobetainyl-CoA:carnitine CoA-transferase CaiB-like acyl-CoA transferase
VSQSTLPLAGIRVIDAATYIAAPAAAAILADFGAEVIKIERPPVGDPFRFLYRNPAMPASPHNYCFQVDNRNKRSLGINLGTAGGQEIFRKLVAQADILVTNYQPQMQARYQLRYEDLAPLNPRLIYAMVTGYGENGEEADKPGYDMTAYYARSGLMNTLHYDGSEPSLSPCGFGDHPTSVSLFASIMVALYRRLQTGQGGKVWTTLAHNGVWSNASVTQAALCGDAVWPPRVRRETALNPLVNHYRTSDGERVLLCLLDVERDWGRLCRALQRDDLTADARYTTPDARRTNHLELIAILDAEIARHPLAYWKQRLTACDVLFGIVPATQDLIHDEQLNANGVFRQVADAPYRTVDSPLHVDGIEKAAPHKAHDPGADSHEILAELGYSTSDIEAMTAAGVL